MPKQLRDALDALEQRIRMTVEHIENMHPVWRSSTRGTLEADLHEPGRELAERLEEISGDGDLSGDGKRRHAGEAAREALLAVTAFEAANVAVLRQRAEALEATILGAEGFRPPTDPAERLGFEMRAAELRRQLSDRDQLEVWNIYLQADDPEVRHIIETSHPAVRVHEGKASLSPLVDPEQLEASKAERAMAAAPPEQAAELEALRYLADAYEGAAGMLRTAILEEGGHALEADAPVEVGAE